MNPLLRKMNVLKGIFLLTLQALLVFITISVWGLLSLCMFCGGSHSFYLKFISIARFGIYTNMAFISRMIYPMEMQLSGTVPNRSGRLLVICNHKTRLDWFMLWMVFNELNLNSRLLIVMKEEIRSFPIMGWAVQFCAIFLKRNRAHDHTTVKSFLENTREQRSNEVVLLFPEGTDLSDSSLKKNALRAKKLGLNATKYTLLPRTTGFEWFIQYGDFDQIADLTLEYDSDVRIGEEHILAGKYPKGILCHIESIKVTEQLDNNPAEWLRSCFQRKEESLRLLHEKGVPFSNNILKRKREAINFVYGHCLLAITLLIFLSPCYISIRYFAAWLLFSTIWQLLLVKLGGFDQLVLAMSTQKNTTKQKEG